MGNVELIPFSACPHGFFSPNEMEFIPIRGHFAVFPPHLGLSCGPGLNQTPLICNKLPNLWEIDWKYWLCVIAQQLFYSGLVIDLQIFAKGGKKKGETYRVMIFFLINFPSFLKIFPAEGEKENNFQMSSVEANASNGRARSCLCRWYSGWINLSNFLFQSCFHYFNPDSFQHHPGRAEADLRHSIKLDRGGCDCSETSLWGFSLDLWDAGVAIRALCLPCRDLTLFWLKNSREVDPWWPWKEEPGWFFLLSSQCLRSCSLNFSGAFHAG